MKTEKLPKRKHPRVQIDYSQEETITDQAAAKELTMSSIIKKLEKGIMPSLASGLIYSSDLGLRNLQDVVEKQRETEKLFYQLPVEIRNLMKHDISNFESVVFDPKNADVLKRHNLLIEQRDNHKELLHAIKGLKESSKVESLPTVKPTE